MSLSRRALLLGGAAVTGALLTVGILRDGMAEYIDALLLRHFGETVARASATQRFVADFLADRRSAGPTIKRLRDEIAFDGQLVYTSPLRNQRQSFDTQVLQAFLMATDIIKSIERGSELTYFGLHDPYLRPCVNPLSVQFSA